MRRVRLLVEGRVQGVGFRYSACSEARRLHLGGWVGNRCDGSVEIEAEGEDNAVDALVSWCQRGPALAKVVRVETLSSEFVADAQEQFFVRDIDW